MSNNNMDMTAEEIFRLGMEVGRKQVMDHIQHQCSIGKPIEANGEWRNCIMKRYIVEVTRTGHREVEAIDCDDAEQTASDLNACDGVQWSDFVNVVRVWEKDYEGMRWGDLSPEDRKFLLSDYELTDIDA